MPTELNHEQISRVAELLRNSPEDSNGLNFYSFKKDGKDVFAGDLYPSVNSYFEEKINFFFFMCIHDYGFWYGDNKGYISPIYGKVNGVIAKGSDLLWRACTKFFITHDHYIFSPNIFSPSNLGGISPEKLVEIFSDDNGPIPFPDFEARLSATRAFGRWFSENGVQPSDLVVEANHKKEPLEYFLRVLGRIPGYNKDLLQKRNMYLAMILANRPERFLKITDVHNWRPLIDYHLMRLSLRLGLVDLDNADVSKNEKREWVSADKEKEIRLAVYWAMKKLIEESGKPMFFVDEKMWMGRSYCPEMETQKCDGCIFSSVCKKRTDLFQPIFRTTDY